MPAKERILLNFNINEVWLETIYMLEDELEIVLKKGKIGEVDGHEISDNGTGKIFVYGSDMQRLLLIIQSVLKKKEFSKITIVS
jgi:hypothetical protein